MTVKFDIGNRGVENIAVAIKRIYPVVSVECRYIFFVDTVGGVCKCVCISLCDLLFDIMKPGWEHRCKNFSD